MRASQCIMFILMWNAIENKFRSPQAFLILIRSLPPHILFIHDRARPPLLSEAVTQPRVQESLSFVSFLE